jgi:hypothetical protein
MMKTEEDIDDAVDDNEVRITVKPQNHVTA